MRCGRCGNENDDANRFCGMCGGSLVATTQTTGQAPAAAPTGTVAASRVAPVPVKPVQAQSAPRPSEEASLPESARFRSTNVETRRAPFRPEVRTGEVPTGEIRPREVRVSSPPVITGHSFLGLSTPGPAVDRHDEHDPLRPSSNLDYLLEDEEEPKRGWGKLVLIVIALGLAIGLGYLHFKQAGFGGLTASAKKPTAVKPTSDAAQGTDSAGAAVPATSDNTGQAASASGAGTAPSTSGATTSSAESAATQATSTPQGTAGAQNSPSQNSPSQVTSQPTPSQAIPSPAPGDPNVPATSAPPAGSAPDKQAAPVEAPPGPKPATIRPAASKPTAAKPMDPVSNAERYIYGRGVRQDCDHGLRLLKPPAEQSNAKAMILLGALYSTGTCAPRDLPTAYRWFALALHKEPDNQALQDDLQKLWGQMTQPERQLAIKLSQ